ncbi:MAG: class I SAM-dependent methyltransferase, partial [Sphaerospermopsis kisseleviana]
MGADVMGIEPGIHGQAGSQRFGVPVVRDFFPSSKVSRSFDIITAFFVLEHLRDVQNFLMNIREHLKNDGILFLSVPDCEPYLAHGDISFLFHEHWNYFTEQSLYAVLTQILG